MLWFFVIVMAAMINVPFFPDPVSTGAFGFCLGLAVALVILNYFLKGW